MATYTFDEQMAAAMSMKRSEPPELSTDRNRRLELPASAYMNLNGGGSEVSPQTLLIVYCNLPCCSFFFLLLWPRGFAHLESASWIYPLSGSRRPDSPQCQESGVVFMLHNGFFMLAFSSCPYFFLSWKLFLSSWKWMCPKVPRVWSKIWLGRVESLG